MDAAKDGLNEATLADDGDEDVDQSVVDCSTTPCYQLSASPSTVSDYVIAKQRSSICSARNVDFLIENVVDADSAQAEPCESADDVEATTTTTTISTSVPLLEQLVSSPCEVVTSVPTSFAAAAPPPPIAANDADSQSSLNRSFLQKLESFVSSVGQVAAAPLPRPPLTGWIRRPVFPSRSGASATGSVPMEVKRSGTAGSYPYSMSVLFPSPSAAESSRPLDLSAKRMESPSAVDSTRSSQRRCVDLIQHGSDEDAVEGQFVDVGEVQPNGANSLACLERDFGEHSTILNRLGSSRDRQRQAAAAAALTMSGGAANRRDRTVMMSSMAGISHASTRARICPPGTVTAPYAWPSVRSFIASSRYLPTSGQTGIMGGKPDSRPPTMSSTTTTATALRCLQCGRTFFSLPELTLHMIQSAHYANLICAAAAYNVEDEEDCVVVDAYNSRKSSNNGVDHSMHKTGALPLSRGKGLTEMADAYRRDNPYKNSSDVRRRDYLEAAVSPARSLDDESVSSAGLTETESLRSPTSTGSPSSPSYENVGSVATDDDLTIMSKLLRLQRLLSRTVLDNIQTGTAVSGHVDWTAAGFSSSEQRRRQLVSGRSSKNSVRELDHSAGPDSLPIDLRSQRADGSRHRDSQSRQMPHLTAAAKTPALTYRPSSTVYLEKLLDSVRGCRKSMNSGIKRSAFSKWHNGKHPTKKHRTYNISRLDCNLTRYDAPQLNGNCSAAAPTLGKVCLRKRDVAIHGCRESASNVKLSPPVNREFHSSRRQETADSNRRSTSNDSAVQPIVIDGDAADSPALSVNDRDADVPTVAGRDLRRTGVDNDQSEYAARFGKYYRLAQELSNKSE